MNTALASAKLPATINEHPPLLSILHFHQTSSRSRRTQRDQRYDPPRIRRYQKIGHAENPHLAPDDSILILGFRSTGKTSLGILAASHTGFRLIDADQHFYQTTGLSRAAYASRHGFEKYKITELSLMRDIIQDNPKECIIVCGPGSAENTGQALIKTYMGKRPIIHVMRDPEDVHQSLRARSVQEIGELADKIGSCYRSLSSHEFYNISEPIKSDNHDALDVSKGRLHPALSLKQTEADFLRLVDAIRNRVTTPRASQAQHSLEFLAPEARPYTYALVIDLDDVTDMASELRSSDLLVDAVELTIDMGKLVGARDELGQAIASRLARQYYLLRRYVKVPVILDVRRDTRAGKPDDDTYLGLLLQGLKLAPEYITVDLSVKRLILEQVVASKASTKIIGHFFDAHPAANAWNSQERFMLLSQAGHTGCDIVRICQPFQGAEDDLGVQNFCARAKHILPVIVYNTSRRGRRSCFLNQIFTPVTLLSQATLTLKPTDHLLTVRSAQQALYASFMLDKLVFGIFGSAVSAAMSPPMHNAAFDLCGMPHVYQTFQAPSLAQVEHIFYHEEFGGASISAPFKEEIMPRLHYVSPEASAIGAVNTLIPLRSRSLESLVDRNKAGPVLALYGDNTDWIGIHICIKDHLSPANAVKDRTTALVLGAGGIARAAVYTLLRLGVRTIAVWNRTSRKAEQLAVQFDGKAFPVRRLELARSTPSSSPRQSGYSTPNPPMVGPAKIIPLASMDESWPAGHDQPTIIVDCTAKASQPPPRILLPEAWLRSAAGGVVVELAYNQRVTPLCQQMRPLASKGWIYVNGLQVLPEQGTAQFELFTGRKAPQHLMRALITEHAVATADQVDHGS